MAEGLISGILGDDEDKPDVESAERMAGPEAFAAAVAAIASRQDPQVARDTSTFLVRQARLLEVQTKHLEDEHALRLALLRGQQRENRLRRFGTRVRIAFQLFGIAVTGFIGAGVGMLIHDAFTSRQVVIEPFHAPPALAQRGLDGTVVAGQLLDSLGRLQDATRSSAVARTLSGAWTSNIKLEVPETGLSIAEISRLLKERFGHDVHIDGELVADVSGALTLTVRGNGVPAKSFGGAGQELEKLTVQAAEYIYAKSQPARWAAYLNDVGREQEALAFCPTAIASADPQERPLLLNAWGNAIESAGGSTREALSLFRAAVKLDSNSWVAHNNIQNALMLLGDEEGAWKAAAQMRADAGGRPGRARELDFVNFDLLTWNLMRALDAVAVDASANGGTTQFASEVIIADFQIRLHDPQAAELVIKTVKEDPHDPNIAAMLHFVRGQIAVETGDVAKAAAEMEAFGLGFADPAVSSNEPGYNCWIAPAEEAAGYPAKADAVLKAGGSFVDCYRFRADILDSRRDWPGAQQAYGAALALAPDLPAAYYSYGIALARHGELGAASEKFKQAHERGPHWADPLKAWGDLLLQQGHTAQALAMYDEAIAYAPNWEALKRARERAAQQKS